MSDSLTIRDLPAAERPRERLQKYGAASLSAAEILAVIMGRGIAGESVMVTAAQLKACFEVANRLDGSLDTGERRLVKTPEDVMAAVGGRLKSQGREHFLALLLDTRSRLIRLAEISVGSLDASIVHPREVFREALAASAASVIFVHNHPSGDVTPSDDDIYLTKKLESAGQIMGIEVLDHVIVGDKNFTSLKRQGLY